MARRDDVVIEIRTVNVYVNVAPGAGMDPSQIAEVVAQQIQAIQEAVAHQDPEAIMGEAEGFQDSDVDGVEEQHEHVPSDPIYS